MSYNDKYPDMSAMYAVKFEYENKLKDKIKELETELDRTRKALDVAVDALKELRPAEKKSCYLVPTVFTTQRIIDEALDKITALEQKDVK